VLNGEENTCCITEDQVRKVEYSLSNINLYKEAENSAESYKQQRERERERESRCVHEKGEENPKYGITYRAGFVEIK
jgi:hypothetical protein